MMVKYGIIAILIAFLFGHVTAGMPNGGKRSPFHPQEGISDSSGGAEKQGKEKQPPFIPGEVLVKFKPGLTRDEIDAIREAYGLSFIKRIEGIGVYRFKIPHGSTVKDMVEALNRDPHVEYAEPNYVVSITVK